MSDLETRLRATLRERAEAAPSGTVVAERVLAEIEAPGVVVRPRGGFRTWMMPLLAAAAVVTVIVGVIGLSQIRNGATPGRPGASPPGAPSTRITAAPAPAVPATRTAQPRIGATGFHAQDLTFVSETQGWALGGAKCRSGGGQCAAVFGTTDGQTWHALSGAAFNVPGVNACTGPCVQHLRFANDSVGYAFGPEALFMTTDGGKRWVRQPGRGADALETLDNNVIRLVDDHPGCPGPCNLRVETAPIGGTHWTTARLAPGRVDAGAATLARSGSNAYVLVTRAPSSGGPEETSTLYTSSDDGRSWTVRGEPCPQSARLGEVDSGAVAAAPDGRITILCRPRIPRTHPADFVALSSDAGAGFAASPGSIPDVVDIVVGDPRVALIAAGEGAYRSVNDGKSWQRVSQLTGRVSFLGFESPTTGHAVTDGGRTVWATHDGGQSWKPFRLP